ncbi:SDR family NAD(P)-dependent oxidoreductase [Roseicyclus mahoneyensis]|uniref:NAD(P)-dependent dehydrogenase (Short-subunit alcohol dehydrogenase family) n=1 Tax=Roseicyclus mahoneyensis TaxID=164332 RepID=A0A316GFB0_9RHOB|nr:SDR family NAD(P)-dependent oxidoreductase [Roseicyclus mahoneyensis]PWK59580.1 NAD(P)-dependent dehydrogenase (short-subunit alcohol dehydrogenase family) [Roseicyclus mahoneyensis]
MEHAGRHALVTGGGTGIGLDIARALAASGAEVTITGRDLARLEAVANETPRLYPLHMNVDDEASVRGGISAAAAERGPIAICIANAGIAEAMPFPKETLAHWRQIMTTNLDGVFLTLQAALATLAPDDWGRMIAISSIAGVRGLKGGSAYTASKHGVIGLVHALSEEYIGGPVTFNAVCPGYVDTPIVTRNATEIAKRQGISEAEARDYLARGNRHKTLLETDEVTGAVMWLCSNAARSVNGQSIQIAGGQVA